MILISAFTNRRIETDLGAHLGLNARAAAVVDGLFETPRHQSISAVGLAVLLTFAGTVGVASSVQSVYEQIFGQNHRGTGGLGRLTVWALVLVLWLALDSEISGLTRHLPVRGLDDGALVAVVSAAFFWWSMHLLLPGRVPWRALLPAVVTAFCWLGLQLFAGSYFSSTITGDSRLYGSVGVIFSLLTCFIAIAAVIVLGALTGHLWDQRRRARPVVAAAPTGDATPDTVPGGQPPAASPLPPPGP